MDMKKLFTMMMMLCLTLATGSAENVKFEIRRGVNIAHFLSQSELRGEARAAEFTEEDARQIAAWGYDHVRLPIDEEQMFLENGEKNDTAFALLHRALNDCIGNGLRVVVDLHILRSHYFGSLSGNPLFTQREAQEDFYECWRKISGELRHYSVDSLAYELLNEPQAEKDEDWNSVATSCYQTVRALEPERIIVLGANSGQQISRLASLAIPQDDTNMIISFHYYDPFMLTHYGATWSVIGTYDGPVHYPGQMINDEDIETISEPWRSRISMAPKDRLTYNKDVHRQQFLQAKAVADKYGLRIYCGEWGCLRSKWTEERQRFFQDLTEVFAELGIANTLWCYKEDGFGIVTPDGTDTEMLNFLKPVR